MSIWQMCRVCGATRCDLQGGGLATGLLSAFSIGRVISNLGLECPDKPSTSSINKATPVCLLARDLSPSWQGLVSPIVGLLFQYQGLRV